MKAAYVDDGSGGASQSLLQSLAAVHTAEAVAAVAAGPRVEEIVEMGSRQSTVEKRSADQPMSTAGVAPEDVLAEEDQSFAQFDPRLGDAEMVNDSEVIANTSFQFVRQAAASCPPVAVRSSMK